MQKNKLFSVGFRQNLFYHTAFSIDGNKNEPKEIKYQEKQIMRLRQRKKAKIRERKQVREK